MGLGGAKAWIRWGKGMGFNKDRGSDGQDVAPVCFLNLLL